MRIAYLAPEIPALSATFVYKEILKLNELGVDVTAFSVHKPYSEASDPALAELKKSVIHIYDIAKLQVIWTHICLLLSHPIRYIKTLWLLIQDMTTLGLFSRNALGLGYRFFYSAVLAKQLISKKCQHLHIHFAHIPTDIGMYASSLANISFSVTAHANDLFERGWLLKEKVLRSAFFATISEFNKRYLAGKGIDTDSVKIIRCGVDEKQFSKRLAPASNNKIQIGVVGRLVEKKGIDTLIHAVSILKNQNVGVELKIAGSGPLEQELSQLTRELKLSGHEVTFLGAMANTDVASFIESLDAFVLPCKMDRAGDMDGIPVVLMEAMLSGVPVISTKLSGIPELVIDGTTGLLTEPDDADALAKAIHQIKHDVNLRDKMIEQAIEKINSDFSLSINSQRLQRLFLSVLSEQD